MSAVILRAFMGSTRVSLSPVKNMMAGYFVARLDVLVGRVGAEVGELFGVFGGAVFGGPEAADEEVLVAQHVKQRIAAPDGAEEIGALGHGRAHEQAAVGAAADGEVLGEV